MARLHPQLKADLWTFVPCLLLHAIVPIAGFLMMGLTALVILENCSTGAYDDDRDPRREE